VARLPALVLCLLALVAVSCGDDDDGGSAGSGSGESAASGAGDSSDSGPTASGGAANGCREVEQPQPKPAGGAKKPSGRLDSAKTYRVVLETNCGEITIRLDQKTAPKTAASFASLTRAGFYDGTVFYRIVPGFVIQGGDPTGSGTGGPGYSVREKPPAGTVYTEGVVAMAKTAVEPPGTSGSQFYIVTAPNAELPPEYALLGEVVDGMDVALAIEQLGDPSGQGTPTQTVLIEKARLDVS
jgi:peptidyl-prolyl cis-trans isomerase B (cyclophilin B)